MKDSLSLLKDIYTKRQFIFDLAKADFRKRCVGSYFGVTWMFVQPIVTVIIYFAIFQLGFKSVPPVPGTPYVLWLIPGIVPWFFFNEAMSGGTSCLGEYNYLVKKVVFNVQILPVIKLVSHLMVHAIFVIIMISVFLAYGRLPMPTWIQVLYYSFALSVYILALTFITSAVNVFFKDMTQIVNISLQFGMWLTPIMWDPELFGANNVWLERFLKINPIYYIVTGYRDSFLQGNWFFERPGLSLYFWLVSLILFVVGLKVFNNLRPHFSDVL